MYEIYRMKSLNSVFISKTRVNRLFKYFPSGFFIFIRLLLYSFLFFVICLLFWLNSFVYCSGENEKQTSV